MFGLVTMYNLLFHGRLRRYVPNPVEEDIGIVLVRLNKMGVTEPAVRKLINSTHHMDGVLYNDATGEEDYGIAVSQGYFQIRVARQFLDGVVDAVGKEDIVSSCQHQVYLQKVSLKRAFPELFEGKHYCDNCSSELEEEGAFCTNNGCWLAVQNVRETISRQLESREVEMVRPAFLDANAVPGSRRYLCDCNDEAFWSNQEPDEDGDVRCPGCNRWCEEVHEKDTEEGDEW